MSGTNDSLIAQWVGEGSSLLDLGCGDGDLLVMLARERKVEGIGIEIDEGHVARCVGKGLQVINADIESGLDIFGDKSFDCAVLSQTLQEMRDPSNVLGEMMRVSRRSIVSITNASHWSKRLAFLFGRVPKDEGVDTQDIRRLVTVADFENLCSDSGLGIIQRIYLGNGRETSLSFLAEKAVYLLGAMEQGG